MVDNYFEFPLLAGLTYEPYEHPEPPLLEAIWGGPYADGHSHAGGAVAQAREENYPNWDYD